MAAISYPPSFGKFHEALRTAQRILLVAHKKPDGDTTGASSSVLNYLLREGKDVNIFCADPIPSTFQYIDNVHRYTTNPAVFDETYDLVIVFDSGDLRYCGVHEHILRLPKGYVLMNVDHHPTNTRYGDINVVLPEASSTAEILFQLFEAGSIQIDHQMATSLLTGLLTDTSNFSNAATTTTSMEAAGKLLGAGARYTEILKHVWQNKSVDSLKIWGTLLSRLSYNKRYDVTTTYMLASDVSESSADIVDGMSNFLQGVVGNIDAILVLRELPGNFVKGSFRSINRDVSAVAKLLGGGGHKKAAGFTVKGHIEVTANGPRIV
ncbi:DHH family phosphoesterase [Patescibacteria group bacterium]|nr:DHH family phosphoesterase [Patescibacteria group bacterium]